MSINVITVDTITVATYCNQAANDSKVEYKLLVVVVKI